jgi:hypothetical protein
MMKKIFNTIFAGLVALTFMTVAHAADDVAKANFKAAKENAAKTYRAARERCDLLSGHGKDVCIAEAKAEEKRSNANAKAQYENTSKARMKARIAIAEADYAVAKEKCNAHTGNAKDVCIKEAKADYTKAKVDAKSSKEIGEIKSDAAQEKRDADYKVELEKCDSLAGPSKDACVAAVKSKFGK